MFMFYTHVRTLFIVRGSVVKTSLIWQSDTIIESSCTFSAVVTWNSKLLNNTSHGAVACGEWGYPTRTLFLLSKLFFFFLIFPFNLPPEHSKYLHSLSIRMKTDCPIIYHETRVVRPRYKMRRKHTW